MLCECCQDILNPVKFLTLVSISEFYDDGLVIFSGLAVLKSSHQQSSLKQIHLSYIFVKYINLAVNVFPS